jgi:metal-dependent amidase/aminoacylase/carboxypeptidase family protein
MRPYAVLGLILLVAPVPTTANTSTESLFSSIDAQLEASFPQLVEIRRDLHRHAENAGNEVRTSRIVADELESLGLEVRREVGGHGVVGILRGELEGPVIGYRADMDAMATAAADPEEFRSVDPGVNHVCGHDVHTTVALAVAEVLAAHRSELRGTVKFLFQPAEEVAAGAKAMLADGVMEAPTPDLFLALHCAPLPVGEMLLLEGMALPGLETVEVRCSGDGDRDAAAEKIASAFLSVANTGSPTGADFRSMVWPPDRPYRLGSIISADSDPDSGDLVITGFVRASDETSYVEAREALETGLDAIAIDGISLEVSFEGIVLPAMVNDVDLGRRTTALARTVLGEDNVKSMRGSIPFFGEDFSYFQRRAPGVMYFLGVANPTEGIAGMPHSPDFQADEEAIVVGARVMAGIILGLGSD